MVAFPKNLKMIKGVSHENYDLGKSKNDLIKVPSRGGAGMGTEGDLDRIAYKSIVGDSSEESSEEEDIGERIKQVQK